MSDWGCSPQFPTKLLPLLLQDVDLQTRINLRFIHDSAAPHFPGILEEHVSRTMYSLECTNSN
jgi:hypothetical protein